MKSNNYKNKNKNLDRKGKATGTSKDERASTQTRNSSRDSRCERDAKSMRKGLFPDTGNDPRWYCTNDTLKQQITAMNFFTPTGSMLNQNGVANSENVAMPGIMRINYAPTYGAANSYNDPLNNVANNIYAMINSQNSRNTNYDPNDLMLYFVAVDSLMTHIGLCRRIYGAMKYASAVNKYLPKALVTACGGNYDDLKQHMQDLRSYINVLIMSAKTYALPLSMTIFPRHQYLVNHFFVDTEDVKSQAYTLTPSIYYVFDVDSDGAGCVTAHRYEDVSDNTTPAYTLTYADIVLVGDEMMNNIKYLWGQQDYNMISADVIKAFGSDNIYTYDYLEENYVCMPSDDAWMHQQIQNLTAFGPCDTDTFAIRQNDSKAWLHCMPSRLFTDVNRDLDPAYYAADRIINSYNPAPSADEILELTRLTNIPEVIRPENDNHFTLLFSDVASELCENWFVYNLERNGSETDDADLVVVTGQTVFTLMESTWTVEEVNSRMLDALDFVKRISYFSAFRYHPYLYMAVSLRSSTGNLHDLAYHTVLPIGDTQNFTTITKHMLSKMNYVIMNHMFGFGSF